VGLSLKGRKYHNTKISDSAKENMSLAHIGYRPSEETRRKMSEAQKGNTNNLGKKASEETKKKKSLSMLGEKNPSFGKKKSKEEIARGLATRKANRAKKKEQQSG
jgi:hypothetical protein